MSEYSPLIPQGDAAFDSQPLAARMRPRSLEEFAGQKHLIGEGKLLRRLIACVLLVIGCSQIRPQRPFKLVSQILRHKPVL